MSRPGSTLIQPEQEQLYVPCGPQASHYKAPVQQAYPPYNPPPQGTPSPYSPARSSPVRKKTPPKSKEYSPQYQSHYLSPSSQHIPVTVKSSPVCQADVSHEILRPTPAGPPAPCHHPELQRPTHSRAPSSHPTPGTVLNWSPYLSQQPLKQAPLPPAALPLAGTLCRARAPTLDQAVSAT